MLRQGQKLLHKGLLIAVVVALMVTLLPPLTVSAQETAATVQVDGLLVYEQPDAASRLIAVMSLGSAITILSPNTTNGFTNIRIPDGRTGWAQLTVAGAPAGATGTGTTSTVGGVIIVAQGNVRIREEPRVSGRRIGFIGWGDTATLLGFDSTGKWGNINFGGLVGWVSIDWFALVSGDPAALASVGTTVLASDGTVVTSDGFTVSVAGGTQVQALGNLRLREEPSLNGARIGLVPWGTIGTLLGFDDTGDWILVNIGGVEGWSSSEWWSIISGDITVTNTVTGESTSVSGQGGAAAPSTTTTTVTGSSSVIVLCLGNVRLRAAPSLNGDRLGSIEWGARLPAFGRTANGDWLLVSVDGVSGWVAAEWFSVVSGDVNSLPVQ